MSDRDRRLLWDNVRLAVVDIETVFEAAGFAGPARDEADAAIAAVKAGGAPVYLAPQKKAIRWRQHALIEAAGLTSVSHGAEPARAVEVMAAPDGRAEIEEQEEADTRGGEHRAAWIAVVTCERGKATDEWNTLVNPGVPVDRESVRYHHLTDDQLRQAPTFARVADKLEALLTPAPGEMLVLVGHNVGYDIGVLRGEMRRIGRELPDVPILDTMGPLAARIGKRAGRSLPDLVTDLGLPEPGPHHNADEDARATAAAVCAMLDLAADQGDYDLPTLLTDFGGKTLASLPGNRPGGRAPKPLRPPRMIAPEHAAKHEILASLPTPQDRTAWVDVADECASRRCSELAGDLGSMVARSVALLGPGGDPTALLDALGEVADRRARKGDGPGVATVLDAIGLVYDLACPVPFVSPGPRPDERKWDGYPIAMEATIIRWHRLRAMLAGLPRCTTKDGCPRCWDGEACGRDELVRRMAGGAWNWGWGKGRLLFIRSLANFLPARGTGGWFTHRHEGKRAGGQSGNLAGPELADATLGWALRTFRTYGDGETKDKSVVWQMGRVISAGGCGEPAFWEMLALEHARPGREQDLVNAINACAEGLRQRPRESVTNVRVKLIGQPYRQASSLWPIAGARSETSLLRLLT